MSAPTLDRAYKIDRNVPVPNHQRIGHSGGNNPKDELTRLFEKMKPGHSILISDMKYAAIRMKANLYIGFGRFTIQTESGGFRIWKIK